MKRDRVRHERGATVWTTPKVDEQRVEEGGKGKKGSPHGLEGRSVELTSCVETQEDDLGRPGSQIFAQGNSGLLSWCFFSQLSISVASKLSLGQILPQPNAPTAVSLLEFGPLTRSCPSLPTFTPTMPPKDSRFATLHTDPRFRRTKEKALKVELDDRFKSVLDEGGVFAKEKGPGKKGELDSFLLASVVSILSGPT